MKKQLISGIVAAFCSLVLFNAASANVGLSPSPENKTMRFQVTPGAHRTAHILLRNTADVPAQVRVNALDGIKTTAGNFAVKFSSQEQTRLGLWTTFDEEIYILNAKESREVSFNISPPLDAPPGVYSGGFSVEPYTVTANTPGEGASVQVVTRVVTPFFVEIPGEKITGLSFLDFRFEETKDNKHFFTFEVENSGNTALILQPSIEISGLWGFSSYEITGKDVSLFAGEKTSFPIHWKEAPSSGFFEAAGKISYFENDIISGEITFIGTQTINLPVSIIPWTILSITVLILILLLILIICRRSYYKKLMKQSKKYKVKKGESLIEIAKNNNISWKLLAKINKFNPPYNLEENQQILIPRKK